MSLRTTWPARPATSGKNSIPAYVPLDGSRRSTARHRDRRVFAGQRADGFYVDLGSIFDLGDLQAVPDPTSYLKGPAAAGINTLAGLNVHSIAIQVPIKDLAKDEKVPSSYTSPDAVIGVWTTASRQKAIISGYPGFEIGPWAQVSAWATR